MMLNERLLIELKNWEYRHGKKETNIRMEYCD